MKNLVVEDIIKYLETLPKDMPVVTGNSYSCQPMVNPVTEDTIKRYLSVWHNMQWFHTKKDVGRDVLVIYDERHYDY